MGETGQTFRFGLTPDTGLLQSGRVISFLTISLSCTWSLILIDKQFHCQVIEAQVHKGNGSSGLLVMLIVVKEITLAGSADSSNFAAAARARLNDLTLRK